MWNRLGNAATHTGSGGSGPWAVGALLRINASLCRSSGGAYVSGQTAPLRTKVASEESLIRSRQSLKAREMAQHILCGQGGRTERVRVPSLLQGSAPE